MTAIENTSIRPSTRRIHLVKIFVMDQPVIDKVVMTSPVRYRKRKPALDPEIRKERRELSVCDCAIRCPECLHQQPTEPEPIDSILQPAESEPY